MSIAVVGLGRMGTALAAALRTAGFTVIGPLGRQGSVGDANVVVLCVPDGQIANAAQTIPADRVVAHCSGITSLAPLARTNAFSMHPLLSVTKATRSFAGAACAISAGTSETKRIAETIARALGMTIIEVPEHVRPVYHAAATVAAGGVMTVALVAERLMSRAGVSRAQLVPLVRSAVENWAAFGAAGLTGPIVRGDDATVARQRAAVDAAAPDELPVWDALTAATRRVASPERDAP